MIAEQTTIATISIADFPERWRLARLASPWLAADSILPSGSKPTIRVSSIFTRTGIVSGQGRLLIPPSSLEMTRGTDHTTRGGVLMAEEPAVTTAPRRPGRKADVELQERRRREILAAAINGFAEAGYSSTEMDAIAERLGMSKRTIYRYFPSKEALFLAAVDEGMNQLNAAIIAARTSANDAIDRITNAISPTFPSSTTPSLPELLIQERAQFRDRKTPTYFANRDANLPRARIVSRNDRRRSGADAGRSHRGRDQPTGLGTMFTNISWAKRLDRSTVSRHCGHFLPRHLN